MGRNQQQILNMRAVFVAMIAAACMSACQTLTSHELDCQISVANRSKTDLNDVVIDDDGFRNQFGYLQISGHGATAGGCRLRLTHDLVIAWEEGGARRKAHFDATKYNVKRKEIRSMEFLYLGNNIWQVVARDGITRNAKVVEP